MNEEIFKVLDILGNCEIPVISSDVHFWMFRPKSTTYVYDNNELRVCWRDVNDKKKYMVQVFTEEISEGDYVIIPATSQKRLTIGLVGPLSVQDENVYLRQYNTISTLSFSLAGSRISYAIRGRDGLISLDELAEDILNCIYTTYEYNDCLNIVSNISSKEGINSCDYLKLTNTVLELMNYVFDSRELSLSCNLNSPGRQRQKGKNKAKAASNKKRGIILLLVLFMGGKFGEFEFGGVPAVMNTIKAAIEIRHELDMHALEMEASNLDNYRKALDIIEDIRDSEIDLEKLHQQFADLADARESLKVLNSDEFAVSDVVTEESNDASASIAEEN